MSLRPLFLLCGLALALATSCGARSSASRLYPPRRSGCKIALFSSPEPASGPWDDLGVASVICHVNSPVRQCLNQLRAEACRMGGDILYDVPDGPMRPTEQGVVYRGRVAHSRPPPLRLPPREAGAEPAAVPAPSVQPTLPDFTDGGMPRDATDTVSEAAEAAPPVTWGTP